MVDFGKLNRKRDAQKSRLYCVLDYESFSEVDLEDVGAWEYSKHPSTEIIVACWRIGTREELKKAPVEKWCPQLNLGSPKRLIDICRDRRAYKIAQNSGFDRLITNHVLGVETSIGEWIDSASLSAAHALPRDLERACTVLKLPHQKNPDGKALIRKFCWPRKPTKKDPSVRYFNKEEMLRFVEYCADDVKAATELFLTLPPLSPTEREVWKLNQRINTRGVACDRKLVKCALKMIAEEAIELDSEMEAITDGEIKSGRQVKAVREWLERDGVLLPNLAKQTIADAVESGLVTGKAKRILEIRQAISKTSTAKYVAFDRRSKTDGRVRDLQFYHGASTGREAGTGLQPHNFPRPTLEDLETATEAIRSGDRAWVKALAGDVMEALSSCVRGGFVATPGFEIFSADFNAIEARKVMWLAEDYDGLEAFASGADQYVDQAVDVYHKAPEDITDEERQVGKAIFLGSGFGMGPPKFVTQCKEKFGLIVPMDIAIRGINSYRRKHPKVKNLWYAYERAAISAVQTGRPARAGRCIYFMSECKRFLYCQLPSGRKIAYVYPDIKYEPTPWGEKRPKLYRWYVDGITKQWVRGHTYGGELTENNTQASSRDVMMESQLRVEKVGYIPLFNVHDECNTEREKGRGSLKEFETLMSRLPSWCPDLPVRVKGWCGERYKKA